MRPALSVALAALVSCSPPPSSSAPAVTAPAVASEVPAPAAVQVDSAAPAATAAPAAATSAPGPAAPAPAPVERSGKVWPFHAWSTAVAVTYNQMPMSPGVPLLAYGDRGWSPHIVERKPLAKEQADKAVALVAATEGGVEVSKCSFPRHAVVLLDGDVPVASINVCFECGDIELWPSWAPEPAWDTLSDKEMRALELRAQKQMKLYDKVFPKWQAYFRDDVGFPLKGTW
jgi:hypothetical protein